MSTHRANVVTTTMAVKMYIDGEASDQAVRLEYHPADPYAIQLHIIPGTGNTGAVWLISREALADAVKSGRGKGMIGDGDVRFEVTTARVRVYLYGRVGAGEAWARLIFTRDGLDVYLRALEAIVPLGQEHTQYDIDAELAKLTTGKKDAA